MSLFAFGEFTLHSGARSSFLIDCDVLTDDDLDALAQLVASTMDYAGAVGIPRGGLRFAAALNRHVSQSPRQHTFPVLLVDDVLTTGESMEAMRRCYPGALGIVIVARGPVPAWITPILHCNGRWT